VIAILMLLVTPLRMAGGGAAMATLHSFEVTMNLGHCDGDGDGKAQKGQSRPHSHSSMAVPGVPSGSEAPPLPPFPAMSARSTLLDAAIKGLGPEASTPPPRLS
jgi:hypothetical protein